MPRPHVSQPTLFRRIATVFLPFAGGYFLSYLFRSTNAIIAPDLVADVGLSAAELGLVTAAYAFAFAAFQIPLGLLLDRFGPRRVQACLLLSAAAGAFVFSRAESPEMLAAGRALIGLGVAGGLMSSFKAITLWFAQERWPLVNGFLLGMGGIGAVAATTPLEAALAHTDWRGVFVGLAWITLGVAAVIFVAVPERLAERPADNLRTLVGGLFSVYRSRLFWRHAPIAVTALAANMAIQTLWAGPWFRDVAGMERGDVARYLALLAATMTAGFVATGVLPALLRRWGVSVTRVMSGGLLAFMAAQAVIVAEIDVAARWPWILFGLAMNMGVLAYPILSGAFPLDYAGRVNTALNLLVFGGFFAAQWGMGAIIGLWPQGPGGGYSTQAYQAAFGGALGLQILAFCWYLVPPRAQPATAETTEPN